jgi:hypothetical protein
MLPPVAGDDRHEPQYPAIESQELCPGWSQTAILLISISKIARITGMTHHVSSYCCADYSLIRNPKSETLS